MALFLQNVSSSLLGDFWVGEFNFRSKSPIQSQELSLAFSCGLRASAATTYDKSVSALVVAGAIALCGLAPLGLRLSTAWSATLATTVGVVNRVHGSTTHFGPSAQPALASCLAQSNILVVHVAYLANGSHAVYVYHAHFAGWQAHLGILVVTSH
jgi:hypothetical protein